MDNSTMLNGLIPPIYTLPDKVSIRIDTLSDAVIYSGLKLTQETGEHHSFEFLWQYGDVTQDFHTQARVIEDFNEKEVLITVKDGSGEERISFKGIIERMEIDNDDHATKGYLVKGRGLTILLDESPYCETHVGKDLPGVLSTIASLAPQPVFSLENIRPKYKNSIDYTVQYNETDFAFLQRMAQRYGEWLYYDGLQLHFGNLQPSDVKLIHGKNFHQFRVKSSLLPVKTLFKSYDPNKAESVRERKTTPDYNGRSHFVQDAAAKSSRIYNREHRNEQYIYAAKDKIELQQMQKLYQQAREANMVTYSGMSYEPLQVGSIVTIVKDGVENEFVIIRIEHTSKSAGHYECCFESIPADMPVPRYTDPFIFQKAETQRATVIDNEDPDGMGRVKVKFFWDHTTDWIATTTSYGGKDKGFYFIPEIGDEVLIGFEGENIERPFVLGAIYNGNQISGFANKENTVKAIRTSSGHIIKFDDSKENQGIIIADAKGQEILVSTHQNIIRVTANGEINLFAGNINMHANKSINLKAKEGVYVNAEKIGILGNEKTTIYGRNNTILGRQNVDVSAPNINYRQSGYTPPETEEKENNSQNNSTANNNTSNQVQNSPNNENVDTNTTDECVPRWEEAKQELRHQVTNWAQELIDITQNWSSDMSIEADAASVLNITTYLGYLAKVIKIDPRLSVAISIGEKAYNYVSNRIAASERIDSKLRIMRFRDDIQTGLEQFKSDTEAFELIFESYKGYCMQNNISCSQAKEHANVPITYLPNKYQWYEALCIGWIKSSIDSPWYTGDFDSEAGFVIVRATYHGAFMGAFGITVDNNIHWKIETKFDNDVLNKKGVYKCLKYVYAEERLNKRNLLKLPLPFTMIILGGRNIGRSITDGMMITPKRDEHGSWDWDMNSKNLLWQHFKRDILLDKGIPLDSLNKEITVRM